MALITRIGSLSPVGHLRAVSAASGRVVINLTISANTKNYNIWSNKGGTYVAGLSDITLTINSGIVVGSTSTATYALDTGSGWTAGDTISIVNNGYICGMGGKGGAYADVQYEKNAGAAGGPAVNIQYSVAISNSAGYIYSGGGGGGGGLYCRYTTSSYGYAGGGGAGNSIGANGTNAPTAVANPGGLTVGGRGGYVTWHAGPVPNGGALGQPGYGGYIGAYGGWSGYGAFGGGGGGGGASGGQGYGVVSGAGGAGGGHGLAIQRNSNTITWVSGNTRVYGGIS